ncbi:ribonuclease catalytic domain-containing protein [Thermodesulfobacteriota bacterium]
MNTEPGSVVEYIDQQNIICSVVLEVKKQRVRLLTETNREVNLSSGRLSHQSELRLDLSMGRDKLLRALKEIANRRTELISQINIKELWEILNTEQEWIDLVTMTAFCFPEKPNSDHESAVIRAFFTNRLYFKFSPDRFFPNTKAAVERKIAMEREAARKNRIIQEGADWLKSAINGQNPPALPNDSELISILKSLYIFDKESKNYDLGKVMLKKAGMNSVDRLFQVLERQGVYDINENVDLYRYDIPTSFPPGVLESADRLIKSPGDLFADNTRKDLTTLPLMTIDGQSTLDYDDAISIEDRVDHYRLGVHIVDVGHYIKKGDILDQEALARGSSIYMPDQKIPMLPPSLAEDICSLKAGELRPAISIMINLSPSLDLIGHEIFPSLIRVKHQLSYYDVNMAAGENRDFRILHDIAEKFRQQRMDGGAVQITLPEINIWVDEYNEVTVNKINRESPGRMLVSEIMIMANWLMGRFLAEHNAPAIFRSQAAPRDRLYKGNEGTLFQNCMQRRLLSRFVLGHEPEHHSGLGLDVYVTATSPIRKYFDLATQRQIRTVFGLEEPSTPKEIDHIIQLLEQPMRFVSRIQYNRHRYWLLKYLEKKIGQKMEATVLHKRRNSYQVLLREYMLECDLSISSGIDLKPEDLVQITIQHVNARKDLLSVFLG